MLHTHYNLNVLKEKPNTVNGSKNQVCHFCNLDKLCETNKVIVREQNILLMENKYPAFPSAYQTVLVEHDLCDFNLSNYPKKHLYKLLHLGIKNWEIMMDSGEFKSVTFFKNYGKYSSASIQHSHMQIIGWKEIDYTVNIIDQDFVGVPLEKNGFIEVNISLYPKTEPVEYNIIISDLVYLNDMADYIQMITNYILNHSNINFSSFNMFFYKFNGRYICKIVPRKITSVLTVGYHINPVPNDLVSIIEDIKNFTLMQKNL